LRSSERHQLKQDQFAHATQETISWASDNRKKVVYTISIVVVVLLVFVGGFYYQQSRQQKASILLGQALQVYSAPLLPPGTPAPAGMPSFNNAADRAKAASVKFAEVTRNYGHTDPATMANYFLGLTAEDLGDHAKAEQYLKDVAGSNNQDIASLAKAALGTLYHDTGRDQLAVETFKSLIDKPTNTVPKASSELALADIYAQKDPTQARHMYETLGKENADNPIGSVANSRLAALK
jgi:tetratricopeptide (TPR) repeat protein